MSGAPASEREDQLRRSAAVVMVVAGVLLLGAACLAQWRPLVGLPLLLLLSLLFMYLQERTFP